MKKIDLHIHTRPTEHEAHFDFSLERLEAYVVEREIDCIAITNHNTFDLMQFNKIAETLSVIVLPGIEIDLEGGQILVISNGNSLSSFSQKCQSIADRKPNKKNSLKVSDLEEVFGDLAEYILIPHYDKKPPINDETLAKLIPFVTAGEVASPKKFMYCVKDDNRLVPVYFSDCRVTKTLVDLPVRQTYIDCDDISFSAIKGCLRDKNKVALSATDGNSIFPVFADGQMLSTGLNVIVGERSSGKSHTLKRLRDKFDNVKYIKQFSLVEQNEGDDERKFNRLLSEKHSLLSRDFLDELQKAVLDVLDVELESDQKSVQRYVDSLLKYARESERHDAFSRAKLFREEKFEILNQKGLEDLIGSTKNLIENIEFREVIKKHISIDDLKRLIVDLMGEYGRRERLRRKRKWINDLMRRIKSRLQIRTAATPISDVDLYTIAMNKARVAKFEYVVGLARERREIMRRAVQGFEVVATAVKFERASQLKALSRLKSAFRAAFDAYGSPYEFLQELKKIDGLEEADYYKYFVRIEYKILNEHGFEVSGGERSEFNLLQEIQDAQDYDMLLIDEPESSFDNLFLKREVNEIIKDISKNMPVVLVTHNSTVGASIKPDYLLCARKEIEGDHVEYRIYSGFPTNKKLYSRDGRSLSTWEVTMGCLEAGEDAYEDRRRGYEVIKD